VGQVVVAVDRALEGLDDRLVDGCQIGSLGKVRARSVEEGTDGLGG